MWRSRALCLQLLAASCAAHETRVSELADAAYVIEVRDDVDFDGLCAETERELGTDPEQSDSDGDGLPDAHEYAAGFDPRDAKDPASDRIIYVDLDASERAVSLWVTLDGYDQSAQGRYVARPSLDPAARRADDFLAECSAVEAEPAENVRRIASTACRFVGLLDRARLRYQIALKSNLDSNVRSDCAAALPFDFVVSDELGNDQSSDRYMLVVRSELASEPFCEPAACL